MEASATSNRDRDGTLDADDSDSAVQRFKVEPNLSDFEDEDTGNVEDIDEESLPLRRGTRRTRSNVWSFFEAPSRKSTTGRSVCLTCHQDVSCNEGSTTAMRNHLRMRHHELYQIMLDGDKVRKPSSSKKSFETSNKAGKEDRRKAPTSKLKKQLPRQKISASDEVKDDLKNSICTAWNTKLYSDVEVLCGVDGGLVKTHRIFLSGLSQFLCQVLLSDNFSATGEETFIQIPDVDSGVLSDFLDNVFSGHDEIADVHPSLHFLGFGPGGSGFVSGLTENSIKTEPEQFNYFEPETVYEETLNEDVGFGDEEENIVEVKQRRRRQRQRELEEDPDFSEEEKPEKESKPKKRKRKRRSCAWNFFNKIDENMSSCKLCESMIRTEGGTTSGMLGHLKTIHTDLYISAIVNKEDVSASKYIANDGVADSKNSEDVHDLKDLDESRGEPSKGKKRRRQKRSLIWNYYSPTDKNSAICSTCNITIRAEGGSTTTMFSHLRIKHPELHDQLQQSRDEEDLMRARQKLLLQPVPKNVESDVDNEEDDDDEDEDFGVSSKSAKREMSDATIKSSPVWMIFKSHDEDDLKVKCTICEKPLRRPIGSTAHLARHVRVHHKEAYDRIKDQLETPDLPETFDPANPIWEFFVISDVKFARCNYCLDVLAIQEAGFSNLAAHLGSEHHDTSLTYLALLTEWRRQRQEECSAIQRMKKSDPGMHQRIWKYFDRTSNKNEATCKSCSTVVKFNKSSMAEMNLHIEQDHPDMYIKFLKDSAGLKTRVKSEDVSSRTCPDCHKVYKCHASMLYHRQTVHSGVRPYKCHVCEMTFARPDAYRNHIHVRTRSYLCSHCGKQFSRRYHRDVHERSHVGDKREKCSFCEKFFLTKQQRMNHERIHTGEKPYQCTHCGRQFTQSDQLRSHTRTHTGEKPFDCNFCGQKFRFISSRNSHKCEGKLRHAAEQQLLEQQHSMIGSE